MQSEPKPVEGKGLPFDAGLKRVGDLTPGRPTGASAGAVRYERGDKGKDIYDDERWEKDFGIGGRY